MENKTAGSRPYMSQKLPLQSFHAQQTFKRGFDVYTESIYSLSVVLRAFADEYQVREMEGLIDEKLSKAQADIRNEIVRLDKIAENNGITLESVSYSQPVIVEAKISSHRSARYANIIREFDNLITKLDAVWLSGLVPDSDYSRVTYEWKRRILRIATHVRGIVRQAMIESRKKAQQENIVDVPAVHDVPAVSEATIKGAADTKQSAGSTEPKNTSPGAFSWLSRNQQA